MQDNNYNLYLLAQITYKEAHPEIREEDLFPMEWNSCTDYKLKSEIIAKAVKNNVLIEEIPEYLNTIERVIRE